MSGPSQHQLEVLAPAGSLEHVEAAIAAGTDAVYLGVEGLSARPQAWDFRMEDAQVACRRLHEAGCRLYVALNTFYGEYNAALIEAAVREIADLGVDALIVADWGLVRLLRRLNIQIPLHASTLLGIHNSPAAQVARRHGVSRVIFSTDLQIGEMAAIVEECPELEFELISHGGLCFNDNRCCRLPHAVIEGRFVTACEFDYHRVDGAAMRPDALSMHRHDIDLASTVGLYAALGISSFKIEGRTRSSQYVGLATARFRQAIDNLTPDLARKNLACYVARRGGSGR